MRKLPGLSPVSVGVPQIIVADTIHTLAVDGEIATAMLIHGDRVEHVGTVESCAARAAELHRQEPELHAFPGRTIVPGFIDAHAHPLMLGQMMSWVDCGPERASSIPEILELLRAGAATLPAGTPVRGYGYEQRNLAERRHPTRFELDEVATDREVYLMNASGHGGVVNTHTFVLNNITRETPNPEGGEFFRDEEGDLTGELSDAACNILTGIHGVKIGHHGPNFHLGDAPEEHRKQLLAAQENFLQGGVTTVGDAQVSKREFDAYLRLAEADELKIRANMYLLSHQLDEVLELGMNGQFGNEQLSFAGIKFYSDGTLGGWTAYFPEGYLGDPCRKGQLYHEEGDYTAMIVKAHLAGLAKATHSQSPTALEMVISAIEERRSGSARIRTHGIASSTVDCPRQNRSRVCELRGFTRSTSRSITSIGVRA